MIPPNECFSISKDITLANKIKSFFPTLVIFPKSGWIPAAGYGRIEA
jgi:hypothetical protein